MSEREARASDERTVVKGLSFNGVVQDGNTVQVDVKDGKIVRIRPFHFDWKYDRKPWRMEARGKTFECAMKVLIPPFTLAYKNRINSPNRVMYPLKRVDWDPREPGQPGPAGATRRIAARASTCASPGTRPPTSSRRRYGASRRNTASRPSCCSRTGTARARSCTPPTAATAR